MLDRIQPLDLLYALAAMQSTIYETQSHSDLTSSEWKKALAKELVLRFKL